MKTILLANDNPVTIELMHELLDSYDYCVVVCDNEDDALKELEAITPDLVIIGFSALDVSDYKMLKGIIQSPDVEKIPIIILTETTSFTDTNKVCQKKGNVCVLHEPVKFSYLMKLIAEKLNKNLENG